VGFGSSPFTGSTVITINVGCSTPIGTYIIVFTGTSGTLVETTALTLTVTPGGKPSFTLSPSPPTLSIAAGSSGTDTIGVTAVNGFMGSVTLTASGLPTGVTAAFSPNPATVSSVLTLTASSAAAPGSYPIAITGTSGTLSASNSIALTITNGCTQTAITPYLEVGTAAWQQTNVATVTSTTTVVNLGPQPLTGTWSWTGPNGFTAATRQLNAIALSAGANVYTATYTNASGCKSTEAFTITAPSGIGSFTLASSASSASITQGSSVTDTITVTDVSPFAGSVTLSVSGLPSGVTAAFATNPTTGSSVLTLTASSTATTGTSNITITGTSGTLRASKVIALTVNPKTTGSACTIDYTITPQNSTSFGAAITIVNNSSAALSSWTLTWSFANGQTISSLWNGNEIQSGANVTVTSESYNGSIPAGGSLTGVGFNGTWNGATNAIPASFSLNGTVCTVN
jgi:hypothetical protein